MAEVADNTVVDGRYRILGRIGEGGMADVFCAEDSNLGRRVALKVLHERFARDRQFVERFRREASAAAGLQHPHVVGVFDRGDHEGTYYIAMELLEGRTLKDLIVAEAPLAQDRAIDLGVQILSAAGFAHRRGIVHRDFKPQNVIVDDHDHLKVTDFGIARAGVSEMTETGSILGTAQYLSPEQAQGHSVDESSDIYSIGVMLYEMLAGRVPFEGDSAVSVAVKHLNEVPAPLHTLRPDVHPALEAVVVRAMSKDPARRFADAAEFIEALTAAREALEVPVERVEVLPPLAAQEERRRPPWLWIATALLVALLLGLLLYLGLRADTVEVVSVTGRPVAEASATLERQGLRPRVIQVMSAAPLGTVVDQDPNPGAQVETGAEVSLRVSSGPGEARVPSVRNLSKRRAVQKLNEAGLNVEEEPQASSSIDRGLAVRTTPREGEQVEKGSRVRLFVSTGPRQVSVPDLVGLSRDSAETRLEDDGLDARVEQQPSGEPADRVLSQSPESGKVDEGSEVTIVVSEGPAQDDAPSDRPPSAPAPLGGSVPDVSGDSEDDARSAVEAEGFGVEVREKAVDSPDDDGRVVQQRPAPGRRLAPGRTVVIYVGRADDGF